MTQKTVRSEDKQERLTFEVLNRDSISKILSTVVYDKAFFFYVETGRPTGEFAISLADFGGKISAVPPKSLTFHLKRGDFENWIREVIGDFELADRIGRLSKLKTTWKSDRTLRRKLQVVVRDRVAELQDLWRHALVWPESVVA
jgi:hypothetical protein